MKFTRNVPEEDGWYWVALETTLKVFPTFVASMQCGRWWYGDEEFVPSTEGYRCFFGDRIEMPSVEVGDE